MTFAVIDRFEEDKAVLLVGEDEKKCVFPAGELPDGLQDGDYITLDIQYDEKRTKEAWEEAKDLLCGLQESSK